MKLRALLRAEQKEELTLLDLLKKKLGRQNYTFVKGPDCRLWVWENPAEGWRVYANNQHGLSFEILVPGKDPTEEKAWAAWNAYRKALGHPV